MDADRHPHLRRLRPRLRLECALHGGRSRHRVAGPREDEEHPVARPVHRAAAALRDGRSHELAEPRQHGPVLVAECVEEARRPLDVGEEEGHRSGRQLPAATDLARRVFSRGRRGQVERRILAQDRLLELAEGAVGLDPELVDESLPRGPIGGERLRLPARAVESEHQLGSRTLPERVLRHERLELAHELSVPAGARGRARSAARDR